MPMKRVVTPMFRYGERDFDEDYMRWGMHDADTQEIEAQSLLRIVNREAPVRILDIACGLGRHCVSFARAGHLVTGADISEAFVEQGRRLAQEAGVAVEYLVQDVRTLAFCDHFDVVTWVEQSFCDEEILQVIYRSLKQGGLFICDLRNPDHPKARSRGGNWRTWQEHDGVFELERHETDEEKGIHEDVWITIDTESGVIEEKCASSVVRSFEDKLAMLGRAGFRSIELRTMKGEVFTKGDEPYWLWVVAAK